MEVTQEDLIQREPTQSYISIDDSSETGYTKNDGDISRSLHPQVEAKDHLVETKNRHVHRLTMAENLQQENAGEKHCVWGQRSSHKGWLQGKEIHQENRETDSSRTASAAEPETSKCEEGARRQEIKCPLCRRSFLPL
ncbi:expressed unknown protein [Seminavis robusta]|uniref:Uncharacterized protein n=1 Tax=Seminavis robusta TaxID=568900 RepID=A0A9N8DSQ5_9STRA|nr:expressed unknown protein [Seminavis robusta]|eukprot:Sro261_g101770.1 n/a (138) ;mRNA; f:47835-48248